MGKPAATDRHYLTSLSHSFTLDSVRVASTTRNTNWLASTLGLFVWLFYWFKNEPHSVVGHISLWGH